jgi:hypothetical protein
MNRDREPGNKGKDKPAKVYNDEMNNKGNSFLDTDKESKARDMAKVNKALNGQGQKMDSVHPDDLKETRNDRMIEQERRD